MPMMRWRGPHFHSFPILRVCRLDHLSSVMMKRHSSDVLLVVPRAWLPSMFARCETRLAGRVKRDQPPELHTTPT